MNSGRRCPFYRAVDDHAVNSAISGGFPHSEIHGSKPITGSPWLIAGYHVLHRLLLPRHPPNALLALDPIQKETGPFRNGSHRPGISRSPHTPIVSVRLAAGGNLVSVLTWKDCKLPASTAARTGRHDAGTVRSDPCGVRAARSRLAACCRSLGESPETTH